MGVSNLKKEKQYQLSAINNLYKSLILICKSEIKIFVLCSMYRDFLPIQGRISGFGTRPMDLKVLQLRPVLFSCITFYSNEV